MQTTLNKIFKDRKDFRTMTQIDRMRYLFTTHLWVSTRMLRTFAYQYNARIHELRREPYNMTIEKESRDGLYGFRYVP